MFALRRQCLLQLFGTFIVVLASIVGVSLFQTSQLNRLKAASTNASPEDLRGQLESEQLYLELLERFPTFGFNNLIADWVFLDFIQYFGDTTARNQIGYDLSPEYFEVILNRDPYFKDAYLFLSSSTTLYAGRPDRTVEIMNQHVAQLLPEVPPKSYFIWRYKGTDELLFLGDSQAAQQSFATAAEWASVYSDPESQVAEQVSQGMAEYLARNPQSKSAQIAAWSMVLSNALDDNTRQYAISKIEELGGNVFVDEQGRVQIQPPAGD